MSWCFKRVVCQKSSIVLSWLSCVTGKAAVFFAHLTFKDPVWKEGCLEDLSWQVTCERWQGLQQALKHHIVRHGCPKAFAWRPRSNMQKWSEWRRSLKKPLQILVGLLISKAGETNWTMRRLWGERLWMRLIFWRFGSFEVPCGKSFAYART